MEAPPWVPRESETDGPRGERRWFNHSFVCHAFWWSPRDSYKSSGWWGVLCVGERERERAWFWCVACKPHAQRCAWATCPLALHCAPDTAFIVNSASFPEPMLICSIHEMRLMYMCVCCDAELVANLAQSSFWPRSLCQMKAFLTLEIFGVGAFVYFWGCASFWWIGLLEWNMGFVNNKLESKW